jgi:hypothetical protein
MLNSTANLIRVTLRKLHSECPWNYCEGRPEMYDHSKYPKVREDILDSLDRYAQDGVPTGGFLEAVLSNNLMESFTRADFDNQRTMFAICGYIYNELPASCHGSPKRVEDWLNLQAGKHRAATV